MLPSSFVSLQQTGKNDNVSLVLFVGFCIFLGFFSYSAEQIFEPGNYKTQLFVITHSNLFAWTLLEWFTLLFFYFQNIFRVPLAPRSNQTVVCPKLYAVKMVSQNYQIFFKFRFCEREHFTYKIIHIYLLLKGKDGKDGQNGEIFSHFSLLFYG